MSSSEQPQRRLAAILMMDVVGYSRLMAADEGGAFRRLRDARAAVLDPCVARHDGRLVKVMGDGALVEFASVTDAVRSAMDIQSEMATRNAGLAEADRIALRIGINLGEVIVDGDDIYGDGVNVASRVEALAEPGGISVTASVTEHLRAHLPVQFRDGGEVAVKNLPRPVRVFHLHPQDIQGAADPRPPEASRTTRPTTAILAIAVVGLVGAICYGGYVGLRQIRSPQAPASAIQAAVKPSVIVMPFENLSGDTSQDYFSDGMTDNLITDLSRVSGLLVIARNTSFSFRDRGEATDAGSVGATLGVRYVVEGSVQRAGDRVRINAGLIDTTTGYQVWAGRLDRQFADLFALQDEVTQSIIDALHVELTQEERRQLSKRYTDSLEAYDLYLRAWEEIWRFNEDARRVAQDYLTRALKIDPDFALAKALMSTSFTNRNGVSLDNNDAMLDRAYALAREAVELDPDLPPVQSALGLVHMFRREFDLADAAFQRAIDLDPNSADAIAMQAWSRHYGGDSEIAVAGFDRALLLNPRAPFPYLNAIVLRLT